jgi:hypothetical protein
VTATVGDGHTYRIVFEHKQAKELELAKEQRKVPVWVKAVTSCYLVDEAGVQTHRGFAICFLTDNFNKEIGRKLALTRCLDQTFPGSLFKPLRTAVWKAYFGRKPKPVSCLQGLLHHLNTREEAEHAA